ncbi:hypothetical protein M0R45_006903 [Rubus argutus]|uniref:Uncharacterized protein n=1 Tax=Rubus argutus TaxID=59490 RepID=A0AAW1YSB0_RUBAR
MVVDRSGFDIADNLERQRRHGGCWFNCDTERRSRSVIVSDDVGVLGTAGLCSGLMGQVMWGRGGVGSGVDDGNCGGSDLVVRMGQRTRLGLCCLMAVGKAVGLVLGGDELTVVSCCYGLEEGWFGQCTVGVLEGARAEWVLFG